MSPSRNRPLLRSLITAILLVSILAGALTVRQAKAYDDKCPIVEVHTGIDAHNDHYLELVMDSNFPDQRVQGDRAYTNLPLPESQVDWNDGKNDGWRVITPGEQFEENLPAHHYRIILHTRYFNRFWQKLSGISYVETLWHYNPAAIGYLRCSYFDQEPPPEPKSVYANVELFPGFDSPNHPQCWSTTYTVDWNGSSPIYLSGSKQLPSDWAIDDMVSLHIVTPHLLTHDISYISNATTQSYKNLTEYFEPGRNLVQITIRSLQPPRCGGTPLFLVWQNGTTPPDETSRPIIRNKAITVPTVGSQYRYAFSVPSWMHYLNATIALASNANLSLEGPGGVRYDLNHPDVQYLTGSGYAMISLNNPPAGDWQVVVDVTEVNPDSIFYLNVSGAQGNIPETDNLAPIANIHLSGTQGKNLWWISDVLVTLSAEDIVGGSGVAYIEYSLDGGLTWQRYNSPFSLSSEGVNVVLARATDLAGNTQDILRHKWVSIDKTPPAITVYTDYPQYTRINPPFVIHCTADDPLPGSGLARLDCVFNNQPVTDGQTVDLFWLNLGQWPVSAEAEDNAGLISHSSASFELIATIESLLGTVDRLCLENYISKAGVCQSLTQKLNAALRDRDRGRFNAAINTLKAFQYEVSAQANKSIKPEGVHLLLMDSSYVIEQLSLLNTQ